MPTDEQKENLLSQIGYLERSRFTNREGRVITVIQGEPPADSRGWADLPPHMKEDAMTFQLNWEGFTPEQEFEVIENVIHGRPFLEGLRAIDASDNAKGDIDSVRQLESNLAGPARDDLERAVSDIERGWTEAASAEIGRMLTDIAEPMVFDSSDYSKAKQNAAQMAQSRQIDKGKEPTR